jgi:hypothetical protein
MSNNVNNNIEQRKKLAEANFNRVKTNVWSIARAQTEVALKNERKLFGGERRL